MKEIYICGKLNEGKLINFSMVLLVISRIMKEIGTINRDSVKRYDIFGILELEMAWQLEYKRV